MDDKNEYIVYLHTNLINGKRYVGITSRGAEVRWGKNGTYYGERTYFRRAIEKYGWDNFKHEILFGGKRFSGRVAKRLEQDLISLYDTFNPEHGYNLTLGGDGTLGYTHSEETKKLQSLMHQGQEPWNKGLKGICHDDEYKRSQSLLQGGQRVLCIETGEIFTSAADAANKYKLKSGHISDVCKGVRNRKSTGGFHWKYVE